jgi:hypothetical protein
VFCFTSLLFRWRARAAATVRSTITSQCTRPASVWLLSSTLRAGG